MDYVAGKNLIKADTRVNLLGNRIVLIAPKDSKTTTLDDRAGLRPRRALAGGKLVDGRCRRRAGRQIRQGGAGEARRLGRASKDSVAQAENVRAALLLVARGEAPLGIVYSTDAAAEPNVKIVGDLPRGLPSADHLSGRADQDVEERRRQGRSSTSCAAPRRAPAFEKQGFTVLVKSASST